MKNVTVLMSTYNGETYLKEQIDSILAQEGIRVKLLVRDDGSKDSTQQILDDYSKRGLLEWYKGENLKSARSFMNLVDTVSLDADYYAFSDQDDFWEKDKLSRAIDMLNQFDDVHCKQLLYKTPL